MRLEECSADSAAALHCLGQYYAELDARLPGGFRVEKSSDPELADLTRPRGTFIVAFDEEQPVGCVALKGTGLGYGEIKRMWVSSQARGSGLARLLIEKAEAIARELGMTLLRLDTNSALTGAIAVYRHWGWTEIARYNADPYAEMFFEKTL